MPHASRPPELSKCSQKQEKTRAHAHKHTHAPHWVLSTPQLHSPMRLRVAASRHQHRHAMRPASLHARQPRHHSTAPGLPRAHRGWTGSCSMHATCQVLPYQVLVHAAHPQPAAAEAPVQLLRAGVLLTPAQLHARRQTRDSNARTKQDRVQLWLLSPPACSPLLQKQSSSERSIITWVA